MHLSSQLRTQKSHCVYWLVPHNFHKAAICSAIFPQNNKILQYVLSTFTGKEGPLITISFVSKESMVQSYTCLLGSKLHWVQWELQLSMHKIGAQLCVFFRITDYYGLKTLPSQSFYTIAKSLKLETLFRRILTIYHRHSLFFITSYKHLSGSKALSRPWNNRSQLLGDSPIKYLRGPPSKLMDILIQIVYVCCIVWSIMWARFASSPHILFKMAPLIGVQLWSHKTPDNPLLKSVELWEEASTRWGALY